ncbi:MAG: DUF5723 family protein [Bacteroidota bacterium]|nr:DUF5723 family protein [Bacteroidota bacterium]
MYCMRQSYKAILFVAAFFCRFYFVYGNEKPNLIIDSGNKVKLHQYPTELYINLSYTLDSRGITTKSIYDYFMGKHFTTDDINLLNRNLKNTSVLGQDFIVDIVYKRKNHFLNNIHYGFRSHFDGSIGKDLAGLASRGNAPYAGRNLDNMNLLFRSASWHKVGVSFGYYNNKQSEPTLALSLNYVSGNKYTYIHLSNTQIYTQQNGDYIDARWNVDYRSSVINKLFGFVGNGASIDFAYQKYFNKKNKIYPIYIQAQITDLGFITWNKNNKNLSWDSAIRFSGLDVGNIAQVTSKNYTDNLSDSLKNLLNSHYNYLKNSSVLPAIFLVKISKKYEMGSNLKGISSAYYNIYTQIDYMIYASYKPQLAMGVEVHKSRYALIPQIRFGGYGDYNIDLSYQYKSRKNKFQMGIKLNSLEALVAPKYQSGLGLMIQSKYTL